MVGSGKELDGISAGGCEMLGSCSLAVDTECDTDGESDVDGWWLSLLADSGAAVDVVSSTDGDDDIFDLRPCNFALPDDNGFWCLCQTKSYYSISFITWKLALNA